MGADLRRFMGWGDPATQTFRRDEEQLLFCKGMVNVLGPAGFEPATNPAKLEE
jgi:hypothetical protein